MRASQYDAEMAGLRQVQFLYRLAILLPKPVPANSKLIKL